VFSTLAPAVLPLRGSVTRQIQLAHANGFDALDLPIPYLLAPSGSDAPSAFEEALARAGLRSGGWMLPFDLLLSDHEFDHQLRRLGRAAGIAAQLGSPWCYYWIEPASNEQTYAQNTSWHVRRLRPIADVLAEHGCRLALEPIGPATLRREFRHEFVYSVAMALELFAAVDRSNVGLLLDCFHWYTSHGTLGDLEQLRASQVIYVHINDAIPGVGVDEQLDEVRLLPGASGVIDIVGFLRSLDAVGYDGPVAVEPFDATLARVPPDERVRRAGESLRSVFAAAGVTLRSPTSRS
jgi:sugar phosphate isomerase/epimerase